MGEFSAEWLALREPADSRARSDRLVGRLVQWLVQRRGEQPAPGPAEPLRVLDLGCGTGANLRWLAPRLGPQSGVGRSFQQVWTCVDLDTALLAELPQRTAAWAEGLGLRVVDQGDGIQIQGPGMDLRVRTLALDLATGLGHLPLNPGTLVVASALLDLVSATWLEGLLRICAGAGCPLLLALTYDGRVVIAPAHPSDGVLIDLVNAHQRRDKGLGPALGPRAPEQLAYSAARLGLALQVAPSDWRLGPEESATQAELIDGWAGAAREQALAAGPDEAVGLLAEIALWHRARMAALAARRSHIRVGHQDALLLPLH